MTTTPLMLDTEWPDEMHCIPVNDLKEHAIGAECWCRPRLERLCFHFTFYHRALDGRDHYRDGVIPLQ